MISLGFDGVNGTSSSQPKLKAWQIHEVEFKGVEFSKFAGRKDPNAIYQVMKVKFANKDGIFEETCFCPKDGDEVRPENNGRQSPSSLEKFAFFIAQLGEQLAPERYAKFKGMRYALPDNFEKMVNDLATTLKPAVGKTFKLKLIGNKKGEAVLPYFVNLSKDGVAYSSNNFIGQNIFFTPYELETMEKQKNAKPTDMGGSAGDGLDTTNDVVEATPQNSSNDDDLNFDV